MTESYGERIRNLISPAYMILDCIDMFKRGILDTERFINEINVLDVKVGKESLKELEMFSMNPYFEDKVWQATKE